MSSDAKWDAIKNLPDAQLVAMLEGNPNDYEADAWQTACEELARRGGKEGLRQRANAEQQRASEAAAQRQAASSMRPSYKWYYIGVILVATVGHSSLGFTDVDPNLRWVIIAVAVAYSVLMPNVMKLTYAFGITVLFAVAAVVVTIAVSSAGTGAALGGEARLIIGLVSSALYMASLLMWIGLIFYWIANSGRRRKAQ